MTRTTHRMTRTARLFGVALGLAMLAGGCELQRTTALLDMPPPECILALESTGVRMEQAPEILEGLLQDGSPVIRTQAAQMLAAVAANRGPDLVRPALTHADPLVRGIAQASYIEHHRYGMAPVIVQDRVVDDAPKVLAALGRLGDPYGEVDLEQVIQDRRSLLRDALKAEPDTAVLAADILARIGDAGARRRLLLLADEADGALLAKAVRAALRDGMDLGPTLLPLAFERSVEGRRASMRAMVASPDPRLQMLLRRGLKDTDSAVRRNAVRATGNLAEGAMVDALVGILKTGGGTNGESLAADALRALGGIGRPAADVLREYIRTSGAGPALQVHAMMALAPNAGLADIGWASARLKSDDAYVRAAAASVLGRTGHPEAQAALVQARNDPVPLVRASVAKALGQIGTLYAGKALLPMLDDPSPLVASVAAWALGATAWSEAVPNLVQVATSHRNSEGVPVRVGEMYARPELAATEALGRIRSDEAREALRRSLESDAWRIRVAAADALRVAADRSEPTVTALEARLADPVNVVRAHALVALEALGKSYRPDALSRQ